ncbi:MAG: exosortase E/protease, VPEID-CTERM system [Steroidobacteraceae bacterium]
MPATAIARPAESRGRLNLAARIGIAAVLLGIEKFLLNFFVDIDAAHSRGAAEYLRNAQHWGFRFIVTVAAALALFAYMQGNPRLKALNAQVRTNAFGWSRLALHVALFLPLVALTFSFYGNRGLHWPTAVLALLWLVIAASGVAALLGAMAPWKIWREAIGALENLWYYAAAAGAVAASAMQLSQRLWAPTAQITFELVRALLRPLIPSLHSNAATQVLDTGRFAVYIAEQCSGLEGAGLLLAFCCAWLLYFRREYHFPRALLIIPAGLALLFFLNVVRIAVLVLIGDAGYPDIALYGFHSQAGWIAFNGTAGGIAYLSRRSAWLSRTVEPPAVQGTHNPTAAFLLPLVTLLAAGMLSRAASGQFETLYPLRLFATAIALWYCWPKLRALDFRFTWRGIATGIGVFILWLAAAQWLTQPSPMPAALAALPATGRILWIAARAIAAVITVPLAEELAYRGFLMRRLKRADFDSLPFGAVGILALLLSSLAFGLAHGGWWLPGTAAGLAYGTLLMRTGRVGEAVAAHATTNGLIVVWVLGLQQWQLW